MTTISKACLGAFGVALAMISAHADTPEPVEVLVLGVYHFDNPGMDDHNLKVDDYLTPERQEEMREVNDRLAAFAPDRIFIEASTSRQAWIDSLYAAYRSDELELESLEQARNEMFQIGFKLAKRLDHDRVYCVGARNIWFSSSVREAADSLGISAPAEYEAATRDDFAKAQHRIETKTILENLIRTNEPSAIAADHVLYNSVFPQVIDAQRPEAYQILQQTIDGQSYAALALEDRYIGAELTAEWYRANIKIYSNILHYSRPEHARVLVIYGAGHKRILDHLFEDNPGFELVPVSDYLKSTSP